MSPVFNPPVLKGIKVHPENPFRFDFILDTGDSVIPAKTGIHDQEQLKEESTKLIKYFLASITIPEKDLWVNLSPYEKDRIIPSNFGLTEMGRDLLAEDYMLKQITASLIYPENEIGKKFWAMVYAEAAKRFGTTNVPVNTFNKVWIVPEKAIVYENAKTGTAYVVESKLKVMLEQDYLSTEKHLGQPSGIDRGLSPGPQGDSSLLNTLGSQIVREILIPELNKEVNHGKNFAQLRQVYNSLILATWYKKKIKDSILAEVYADRNKVQGLKYDQSVLEGVSQYLPTGGAGASPDEVDLIYRRYITAFKKGVYNYIKEEQDPLTQQPVPRKYFSGGADLFKIEEAYQVDHNSQDLPNGLDNAMIVYINAQPIERHQGVSTNPAMMSEDQISASLARINVIVPTSKIRLLADDEFDITDALVKVPEGAENHHFYLTNALQKMGLRIISVEKTTRIDPIDMTFKVSLTLKRSGPADLAMTLEDTKRIEELQEDVRNILYDYQPPNDWKMMENSDNLDYIQFERLLQASARVKQFYLWLLENFHRSLAEEFLKQTTNDLLEAIKRISPIDPRFLDSILDDPLKLNLRIQTLYHYLFYYRFLPLEIEENVDFNDGKPVIGWESPLVFTDMRDFLDRQQALRNDAHFVMFSGADIVNHNDGKSVYIKSGFVFEKGKVIFVMFKEPLKVNVAINYNSYPIDHVIPIGSHQQGWIISQDTYNLMDDKYLQFNFFKKYDINIPLTVAVGLDKGEMPGEQKKNNLMNILRKDFYEKGINRIFIKPNMEILSRGGRGFYITDKELREKAAAYILELVTSGNQRSQKVIIQKFIDRDWEFRPITYKDREGNIRVKILIKILRNKESEYFFLPDEESYLDDVIGKEAASILREKTLPFMKKVYAAIENEYHNDPVLLTGDARLDEHNEIVMQELNWGFDSYLGISQRIAIPKILDEVLKVLVKRAKDNMVDGTMNASDQFKKELVNQAMISWKKTVKARPGGKFLELARGDLSGKLGVSNISKFNKGHVRLEYDLPQYGGIDLTTTNRYLQTQEEGGPIKFRIDPAQMAQLQNSFGFVPVIVHIQPLTNLRRFLGVPSE